MKKMRRNFSVRHIILVMACTILLLLGGILVLISNLLINKQETQQAAMRWSEQKDVAQVSCFFSVNANVTQDRLEEFAHNVDSALEEASIVSASENENARLWADAYSASGKITVKSNIASVTVDAIGIGGDFFLFHPVQLLNGSYFSGNDLMQDYCVLDELTAWKLFGSNDIAGQVVEINGVSHVVTGVVQHKDGKLYETAGLDEALIYVSYDTLTRHGTNNGINHYEIVMPNPVNGFALNYVTENIGVSELEVDIVENSNRYSLLNRIKQIGEFATRAMNGKAIIYPYWENIARAYEDILSMFMFFILLFVGAPVIIIIVILVLLWKRKNWTVKGVILKWKDATEMKVSRMRTSAKENRKNRKKQKQEWVDIKEYEEE